MSPAETLDHLREQLVQAANDEDGHAVDQYLAAIRNFYAAHPEFADLMEANRLARARG